MWSFPSGFKFPNIFLEVLLRFLGDSRLGQGARIDPKACKLGESEIIAATNSWSLVGGQTPKWEQVQGGMIGPGREFRLGWPRIQEIKIRTASNAH